jgi:hypothetical protein
MDTLEEIRLIMKENALTMSEHASAMVELRKTQAEHASAMVELRINQAETGKMLRDLGKKIAEQGKQIGGIGNKFGHLVEGLAYSSAERILREMYQIDHITARLKVYDKNNMEIAEVDVFGYCNSTVNNAVLVEVKSNLRPEEVNEFVEVLDKFSTLFPEHKDKNVYGIITTPVIFDEGLKKRVKNLGIGTATIADETFTMLDIPAKNWKK